MTKLNFNNLKIAACEQTELNDFGEGIFLEGLQKMIESINQEANLIDVGNDAQAQRIIGLLINRLRFEDDLKKYSERLKVARNKSNSFSSCCVMEAITKRAVSLTTWLIDIPVTKESSEIDVKDPLTVPL